MSTQYGAPQIRPKTPGLYALASLLVPGLGTLLAGRILYGAVLLIMLAVIATLTSIPLIGWLIGLIVGLPFWIWCIWHAYRTAQRWNARHGIIS